MTFKDDTRALDRAMEGTRDKTRALNDSLRHLADEGFDRLAKAATQAATTARGQPARRDAGAIAAEELGKLLRQELAAGLSGLFGGQGRMTAAGGMQVVIHNNAGVQVSARESGGGMDQKQLEITIDQMVANSLLRGRQTGGVMRTLFGLAPSLLGR